MSSTESLVLEFLRLRHGGESLTVEAFLARCPDPPADLEPRLREAAAWTPGRVADAQRSAQAVDEVDPTLLIPREAMGRRGDPGTATSSEYHQRYEFVRQLGEGGFGVVHLVRDSHYNGELRALKVIRSEHTKEALLSRFRNEIVVLRALNHDGIPLIYNDGLTPTGEIYYTMTYVEGPTLREVLERGDPIPTERLVQWARQLLSILEYAHSRGVVHRDLKPSNIVLKDEGTEGESLQVLDFGIAKVVGREGPLADAQTLVTGVPIGTPDYMSPEQVTGEGVDGRTDIFSLGIILYQFCGGRLPFKGETSFQSALARVSQRAKPLEPTEAPAWFASWIDRLLEKDAKERPSVGAALAMLVDAVATSSKTRRRPRAGALMATALVLPLLGFFGWREFGPTVDASKGDEHATRPQSQDSGTLDIGGGDNLTSHEELEAQLPRNQSEEPAGTATSTSSNRSDESTPSTAGPFSSAGAETEPVDIQAPDHPAEPTQEGPPGDALPPAFGQDSSPDSAEASLEEADSNSAHFESEDDPTEHPSVTNTDLESDSIDSISGDSHEVEASSNESGNAGEGPRVAPPDPDLAVTEDGHIGPREQPALPAGPHRDPGTLEPLPEGSFILTLGEGSGSRSITESQGVLHTNQPTVEFFRTVPISRSPEEQSFATDWRRLAIVVRRKGSLEGLELEAIKDSVALSGASLAFELPETGSYIVGVVPDRYWDDWDGGKDERTLVARWTIQFEQTPPILESDLDSERRVHSQGTPETPFKSCLLENGTPTLIGRISDPTPGELARLEYRIDSEARQDSPEGSEVWIAIDFTEGTFRQPLDLGSHGDESTVHLRARDRAGNETTHKLAAKIDLQAPRVTLERIFAADEIVEREPIPLQPVLDSARSLEVSSRAPAYTTRDDVLNLQFTTNDEHPGSIQFLDQTLTLNADEETQSTEPIEYPVTLGSQWIEVECLDGVGNRSHEQVEILGLPVALPQFEARVLNNRGNADLIQARQVFPASVDSTGASLFQLDCPSMGPWDSKDPTTVFLTFGESYSHLRIRLDGQECTHERVAGGRTTHQLQIPAKASQRTVEIYAEDSSGQRRVSATVAIQVYEPQIPDGYKPLPSAELDTHPRYPSVIQHNDTGLELRLILGGSVATPFYAGTHEITWGVLERLKRVLNADQQHYIDGWDDNELGPYANHPVVLLTGPEAIEIAALLGGRLPTQEEWLQLCRRREAPIGSPYLGGSSLGRGSAGIERRSSSREHGTFQVGSFPQDTSWCGLADLVGNVSELIEDGRNFMGASWRSDSAAGAVPPEPGATFLTSNAHGFRIVVECTE